jgi:hypothetical protein
MAAVLGDVNLDARVGGGLVHAVADHDQQHTQHRHPVHAAPQTRRGEDGRCRGPDDTSHEQAAESHQQGFANAFLVGYRSQEEHRDGDACGQNHDHVMRMDVGILNALEDEIGEVHGQIAQHTEIDPALQEVGQIDAPECARGMDQVDKRL